MEFLHRYARPCGIAATLFAVWIFTSETYAEMYLHGRFALFNLAGLMGFAMLLGAMFWWQRRRGGRVHGGWFVALALAVCVLFAVIYPLAQNKPDRDDSGQALGLATGAMLQGHYPYYARTYQGDPITPMPGCLLLAAPFQMLGLMLAAILTACVGFFVRLDLPRLYLLAGIAFGIMLGTPGFIYGVIEGFGHYSLLMMAYAETAYLLLALWGFRRMEMQFAEEIQI